MIERQTNRGPWSALAKAAAFAAGRISRHATGGFSAISPRARRAIGFVAVMGAGSFFAPSAFGQTAYNFVPTGGGPHAWEDDANWSGTGIPSAIGDTANITIDFTAAPTINLNATRILGTLALNDTGGSGDVAITVAANGGSLIFDATGTANTALSSTGTTNTVSAAILLNDNLNITTNNSLILTGGINANGKTITKTGNTALTLNGAITGSGIFNANANTTTFNDATTRFAGGTINLNAGTSTTMTVLNTGATASPNTLAAGVNLNGGTSFNLTGVAGVNTTDVITGALTLNNSRSQVTLTAAGTESNVLQAGSLTNSTGGFALFRGTALGSAPANAGAGARTNIIFSTAPTLVGGGTTGTTSAGIIPYVLGDATVGNGSGFVTYDSGATADVSDDIGIRLLNASEVATSVTGATTGDNVRLSAANTVPAGGSKTINSLQVQGFTLAINSASTVTVTSGAVTGGLSTAGGNITGGTLNFAGADDAYFSTSGNSLNVTSAITGATTVRRAGGSNTLSFAGVISNNGATPTNLFISGISEGNNTNISGASTFTGTVTLDRGSITLGASTSDNTAGPLGIATTPLIMGTATSGFSERLTLLLNNNITMGRDIQATQPRTTSADSNSQRYRVGINATGTATATIAASSTVTFGAATGSARRFSFIAGTDDTLIVDGLVANLATTDSIAINEGNAAGSTGPNLGGIVRLTNPGNTFTGQLIITQGNLRIGASVPNANGASVVGTNATLLMGDGATLNNETVSVQTEGAFDFNRAITLNNFISTSPTNYNYLLGTVATGTSNFPANITTPTSTVAKTLRLNAQLDSSQVNFGGIISADTGTGALSVEKVGAGTVLLNAVNTYDGTTTAIAGTLGGTGTIPGGGTTINSGASLLGGTGASAAGTLTVAGPLTLADGSIVRLALGNGGAHSSIIRTGGAATTFDADQAFNFVDFGFAVGTYDNIIAGLVADPGTLAGWKILNPGIEGTFAYDGANIDLTLTTVPEPAGAALLGLVATGLLARRRTK